MRKMRIISLCIAILLAVGAALATPAQAPCSSQPQFYRVGSNYYPAGIEGYDFVCEWGHFSTCTYYFDAAANAYRPCKSGKILWLR